MVIELKPIPSIKEQQQMRKLYGAIPYSSFFTHTEIMKKAEEKNIPISWNEIEKKVLTLNYPKEKVVRI